MRRAHPTATLQGVTTSDPLSTGSTGDPRHPGLTGTPAAPQVGVPAPAAAPAPPSRRRGRTIGRTLAAALLIFVTVVLVLFVLFNTQRVQISLVFTDVRAPLVLALLIAVILGGLVVVLAGAVRAARRRNR